LRKLVFYVGLGAVEGEENVPLVVDCVGGLELQGREGFPLALFVGPFDAYAALDALVSAASLPFSEVHCKEHGRFRAPRLRQLR